MSAISAWILGIVGVVVLSIIVDLVMPNGSTSKFIKNIFAFVIVIVILSPIVSFLSKKDIKLEDIFENNNITIQEEFLSSVNQKILNKLQKELENDMEEFGISGVQVGLKANIFEEELNIEQVSIDLKKCVIDENISHIDIKTSILKIVLRKINIEEEKIVFYE